MRKPIPASRKRLAALALLVAFGALASALELTSWRYRQTVPIERAGAVKFALPPATLDALRGGFEDLRLLDPAGREVPFALERAAAAENAGGRVARPFRATLLSSATQIVVETGTSAPLLDLALTTPAPAFFKSARLEVSNDGREWTLVRDAVPLFRQFGATQLQLDLERRRASYVRLTIDDSRAAPVAVTGVTLGISATRAPAPTKPLPVRIVRREEFAGETVLTLDVGGAHVSLASLRLSASDALFARHLRLTARELQENGDASERTLASGTVYRVAADGLAATARLELPLDVLAPSRELLLHVENGDSPPLAIDDVTATERPTWLVFAAATAGPHVLLTGNPDAPAPRYDLATLGAAWKELAPADLALGSIEPVPGYQRTDALADVALRGAALDPAPWRFRKPVQIVSAGVQQLELDLDVLAAARADLADLRLVAANTQVPYLLERTTLARPVTLPLEAAAPDPKRGSLSRWAIKLPRAGVPLTQIALRSSTTLFQRQFRVFERVADDRGGQRERTLAQAEWSKTPGHDAPFTLALSAPLATDSLWLETDNGDNPAPVLTEARASHPVVRLLFKSDIAPLALYYGNPPAAAPRYDLALIAGQILSREKNVATLGREEQAPSGSWSGVALTGRKATIAFWGALALVVIVLLVVVAKLLPKPAAPPPRES